MNQAQPGSHGTLVVYASKQGSTRQYAEWIAEDLSARAIPFAHARPADLEAADTVVLGSAVRMGSLILGKWIKENWRILSARRLILFSVSATPPDDTKELRETLERSLAQEMIGQMTWVPLHGRLTIATLPLPLRLIMKAASRPRADAGKGSPAGSPAERMVEFDGVARESIAPILKAARARG
jgi:menaquinone-dependent protoporphyrinogen IX oxidase